MVPEKVLLEDEKEEGENKNMKWHLALNELKLDANGQRKEG